MSGKAIVLPCHALQGHKIKNPRTQLAQRLRQVPARLRLVISGTPIQNDLLELHSLFDFVCPVRAYPSL
jgi:SNF2 family DNA or RNA helicase